MNADDKERLRELKDRAAESSRVMPIGLDEFGWLCSKVEELEADIQCMVNKAADNKLDGYRELGARAAEAEAQLAKVKGLLTKAKERLKGEIRAHKFTHTLLGNQYKALGEFAKVKAQLQAIEEVKAGNIRIEDTTSVHLESPTYCAFCGKIFTDAPDQTDQIKAHLLECPKHPLGIELIKVKGQRDRLAKVLKDISITLGGDKCTCGGCVYCDIAKALAELEKET